MTLNPTKPFTADELKRIAENIICSPAHNPTSSSSQTTRRSSIVSQVGSYRIARPQSSRSSTYRSQRSSRRSSVQNPYSKAVQEERVWKKEQEGQGKMASTQQTGPVELETGRVEGVSSSVGSDPKAAGADGSRNLEHRRETKRGLADFVKMNGIVLLRVLRLGQFVFASLVLGLAAYAVNAEEGGSLNPPLIAALVAATLTIPKAISGFRFADPHLRPLAYKMMALDIVAALLWMGIAAALASYVRMTAHYGEEVEETAHFANRMEHLTGVRRGRIAKRMGFNIFGEVNSQDQDEYDEYYGIEDKIWNCAAAAAWFAGTECFLYLFSIGLTVFAWVQGPSPVFEKVSPGPAGGNYHGHGNLHSEGQTTGTTGTTAEKTNSTSPV